MFLELKSLFAPVRNCVGSIYGAPECSDCEPVYRKTKVNDQGVGNCRAKPGTGRYEDQYELDYK